MRAPHPTRNLLDDILFLSVLIITPSAVALYHGVVTIIGTPQYQALLTTVAQAAAAVACA